MVSILLGGLVVVVGVCCLAFPPLLACLPPPPLPRAWRACVCASSHFKALSLSLSCPSRSRGRLSIHITIALCPLHGKELIEFPRGHGCCASCQTICVGETLKLGSMGHRVSCAYNIKECKKQSHWPALCKLAGAAGVWKRCRLAVEGACTYLAVRVQALACDIVQNKAYASLATDLIAMARARRSWITCISTKGAACCNAIIRQRLLWWR